MKYSSVAEMLWSKTVILQILQVFLLNRVVLVCSRIISEATQLLTLRKIVSDASPQVHYGYIQAIRLAIRFVRSYYMSDFHII